MSRIAAVLGKGVICESQTLQLGAGLNMPISGFFGPGEMQKEFEEVAFALEPGEISHVVDTPSGVHLIER